MLPNKAKAEDEECPSTSLTATLALTVFSAAIGGTFQYGYNLSIINAPTSSIQSFINDSYVERWGVGLDSPQLTLVWTFIVSAFSLGGLLGALLAGPMAVRFGRKKSLLLNNVFMFIAAALVLTCQMAGSFELIILARFLVGMNSGVSMNVQPMYFGESAPVHLRGAVAFSSAVFTAFGIFLGQVVGLTEILGAQSLWPYLLASNAVPSLIQVLTLPWFPESPRYLLIDKDDRESCESALARLRGGEAHTSEMEEMLQEKEQLKASTFDSRSVAKTPWALFKDKDLRTQLRTVMAASSAMMLCGNDSIYFYAYYIFLEAGIPPQKIQYATIGTGASEFLASILSNVLIERAGRRCLLIGGYSLMSCWSVVFTLSLVLQSHGVGGMPYLSMVCVFAYILSFGLGPAGVTGILPAEIFDQAARPAAYMIAGSFMWISLFLVGMLFPFIVKTLGNFCFLPFLFVCVVSASFLGFTMPETRGKTLAQITLEFDKKNSNARSGPRAVRYMLGKSCSFITSPQEDNPVEKEDNPVAKEDNPVVKEDNPVEKEDNPVAKEDNPVVKEDNPVAKEDNPVAKEDNPVAKEDNPVEKEDNPVEKEDNPVAKEDNPVVKEDEAVAKEDHPSVKMDHPVLIEDHPAVKENHHTVKSARPNSQAEC